MKIGSMHATQIVLTKILSLLRKKEKEGGTAEVGGEGVTGNGLRDVKNCTQA
jgi:hypothetical protein